MVARLPAEEDILRLRFGAGRHTRLDPADIAPQEASDGRNFVPKLGSTHLLSRAGVELVWTDPASPKGAVNGMGQLVKRDGTIETFVQAGQNVYKIDGSTEPWGQTNMVSVASGARLRGYREQNWQLLNKLIVTDLAKRQNLVEWDGTTSGFTNVSVTGATNFRAQYAAIDRGRAFYGNVQDGGTDSAHLLVASAVDDFTTVSPGTSPGSSLGDDAAFFLATPDTRDIAALIVAPDGVFFATLDGRWYQLAGSNAKDYQVLQSSPRSGPSTDRAAVLAGNDILYGRRGRIEALGRLTEETSRIGDLSRWIEPDLQGVDAWTLAYNARLNRVYCFDTDNDAIHVMEKDFIDARSELSPWGKWTTSVANRFTPNVVMPLFDPTSGNNEDEHVFFGDDSGNVYRLDGRSALVDENGGDLDIQHVGPIFPTEAGSDLSDVQGFIDYVQKSNADKTLNVTAQFLGSQQPSQVVAHTLQSGSNARLREPLNIAGGGSALRVTLQSDDADGRDAVDIAGIDLRFRRHGR